MSVLTMKEALRSITLISAAGKKLDERIHAVAVSGVAHFLLHSDTTLVSELCHAMPRSGRGNALKFWITKNIPVKWNAKAHGGKGGYVKDKARAEAMEPLTSWNKLAIIIEAQAEPFYKKEDKEPSVWNDKAAVMSLVAKLKKHSKEHTLCEESKQLLSVLA